LNKELDENEHQMFQSEFLHSLTPGGMAPHFLNIKNNAIVMLMRNLSVKMGFCNGTRMRVINMMDHLIVTRSLASGQTCFIPRMPMTSTEETGYGFKLKRLQHPLRLAYAITINKAQGQTLDRVGIYLRKSVFDHGQLYVAFSRVRSMNDVRVLVLNSFNQGYLTSNRDQVFTSNVVYQEVLIGQNNRQEILELEEENDNNNHIDNEVHANNLIERDNNEEAINDEDNLDYEIYEHLHFDHQSERLIYSQSTVSNSVEDILSQRLTQVSLTDVQPLHEQENEFDK